MLRVIPLSLLLLLVAIFPARAAGGSGQTRAQELRNIELTTQKIRGLTPTHPVRAAFPSDRAFNAAVNGAIRYGTPNSSIEISRRESVLLGFIGKKASMKDILFKGLSSQVVGLYDYHRKILYVRGQSNQTFRLERYVIAHEYTHALQDQRWNLTKLLPNQNPLAYRNSDAVSAHHAVTEGDAVNTQSLYIERTYSQREFNALLAFESRQKTASLPRAIERQFYFPYTTGLNFVRTLYSGGGMRAVNGAYTRPPSSSFEIMHPHAYLRHWKPIPISLHRVAGFGAWKQVDDDVFGAFGYKLLIWQFAPEATANRITDAYRGDRYVFLESGQRNAMLFKSIWTTAKSAKAAGHAIAVSLQARYLHHTRWTDHGTVLTEPDGAVMVASRGNLLTVAFAPTAKLVAQLGNAHTT